MKKVLAVITMVGFSFLGTTAFAQSNQVPDNVMNHFKTTYPNAQSPDWDKERDGTFEVEFSLDGKDWEAYYDASGNWVRTERDLKRDEVPQAIWDGLSKSEFADWKADDVEEHQTPQHKSVYEVEVKKNGRKTYVYMTPDGKMVS